MKNHTTVATALASLLLAVTPAVYAASEVATVTALPTAQSTHKVKTIHFAVRNATGQSVSFKAGADVITLEKGKSIDLKMPDGLQIFFVTAAPTHDAGNLLIAVSKSISDATIEIK